ncbi:RNA methyltransferase [Adlercreutzia sp. ZJ242]|uniref:TrmH family RNA methyltransferase n=1 Tax=Adlercreutzia sp. ZJ242 TaxID=2709409 RepID=UPI001F14FFE1|nr:RNA methyltransferase [Adlercreutzia sp. ZJ242]
MPVIRLTTLDDARLAPFSRMTDAELRDARQMVGLARAVDAQARAAADARADGAATRATCPADPNRLADGLFIGESKNVIERALAAGIEPFALLLEDCWLDATRPLIERLLARDPSLPAFVATREQMRALTGFTRTRGALAAFLRPPLPRAEDLLAGARRVAVLEDVTNYTNVGAIFRSAAALGVDAVLVTPACHDPFYRRAARVSMGTVFQVPWTRIGSGRDWTREGLPLLRAAGFTTCALALSDDSVPLQDRRLRACDKLALVLGTEGDGLAPATIAACDYTVRIPMDHAVDSLNVAAASAVAFWELRVSHRD